MVLYNYSTWRLVSILILLLGLSIVAAADSAGKTLPVEDGTLFTNIISSFYLFFLGGLLVILRVGYLLIVLMG